MILAPHVVANAPFEIRIRIGLDDGENRSGGFGDIGRGCGRRRTESGQICFGTKHNGIGR